LARFNRNKIPRLSTKKLYYVLKEQLKVLKVGRYKLFTIHRANPSYLALITDAYLKRIMGYNVSIV